MTLIEFKSLKYKNKTKNFGLINFENELTVSKRCVSINLRSIYYLIKKAFKSNQKPFKDFTCKLFILIVRISNKFRYSWENQSMVYSFGRNT